MKANLGGFGAVRARRRLTSVTKSSYTSDKAAASAQGHMSKWKKSRRRGLQKARFEEEEATRGNVQRREWVVEERRGAARPCFFCQRERRAAGGARCGTVDGAKGPFLPTVVRVVSVAGGDGRLAARSVASVLVSSLTGADRVWSLWCGRWWATTQGRVTSLLGANEERGQPSGMRGKWLQRAHHRSSLKGSAPLRTRWPRKKGKGKKENEPEQ